MNLRLGHVLDVGVRGKAVCNRLGLDPFAGQAAAVVGDLDDDVAAFVMGREADGALVRLADGAPLRGRLQPVVGRVAHHVGQRILDQLEHLAVELGVGPEHLQLDVLAELGGEIAHDARQLLPGVADRLHARLHDALLQLGGDVGQPLQRRLELGVLVPAYDLQELVAGQHQLRHHGHQMLERLDAHPQRLMRDLAVAVVVFVIVLVVARALAGGRGRIRALGFRLGALGGCRRRRIDLRRGLAEGAFELVRRHFARTQRPFERRIDE